MSEDVKLLFVIGFIIAAIIAAAFIWEVAPVNPTPIMLRGVYGY